MLAIAARIEDAALLLALRHGFAHAVRDAPAAIVAQSGDGEEMVLRLKGDRFELRLFGHQTRDVAINAMSIRARPRDAGVAGLGEILVGHDEEGYAAGAGALAKR